MTMFPRSAARLRNLLSRLVGLLPPPSEGRLRRLAGRDRRPVAEFGLRVEPGQVELGRRAFADGLYSEALALFSSAIEGDPGNAWAWHGRGDALQLMQSHEAALEAYDKAAALRPDRGIHHGGRANALRSLCRTGDAEEAWRKALGLDPTLGWMRKQGK